MAAPMPAPQADPATAAIKATVNTAQVAERLQNETLIQEAAMHEESVTQSLAALQITYDDHFSASQQIVLGGDRDIRDASGEAQLNYDKNSFELNFFQVNNYLNFEDCDFTFSVTYGITHVFDPHPVQITGEALAGTAAEQGAQICTLLDCSLFKRDGYPMNVLNAPQIYYGTNEQQLHTYNSSDQFISEQYIMRLLHLSHPNNPAHYYWDMPFLHTESTYGNQNLGHNLFNASLHKMDHKWNTASYDSGTKRFTANLEMVHKLPFKYLFYDLRAMGSEYMLPNTRIKMVLKMNPLNHFMYVTNPQFANMTYTANVGMLADGGLPAFSVIDPSAALARANARNLTTINYLDMPLRTSYEAIGPVSDPDEQLMDLLAYGNKEGIFKKSEYFVQFLRMDPAVDIILNDMVKQSGEDNKGFTFIFQNIKFQEALFAQYLRKPWLRVDHDYNGVYLFQQQIIGMPHYCILFFSLEDCKTNTGDPQIEGPKEQLRVGFLREKFTLPQLMSKRHLFGNNVAEAWALVKQLLIRWEYNTYTQNLRHYGGSSEYVGGDKTYDKMYKQYCQVVNSTHPFFDAQKHIDRKEFQKTPFLIWECNNMGGMPSDYNTPKVQTFLDISANIAQEAVGSRKLLVPWLCYVDNDYFCFNAANQLMQNSGYVQSYSSAAHFS